MTSTMATAREDSFEVNIVLMGEEAVGKSSLVEYVVSKGSEFNRSRRRPQSHEIASDSYLLSEDPRVRGRFWDVGSRASTLQRYECLSFAHIVLILYDITRHETFVEATVKWMPMVLERCYDNVVVMLVGTHSDFAHAPAFSFSDERNASVRSARNREVSIKEAESFCQQKNVFFMEISTTEGTNIPLTLKILRIRADHLIKRMRGAERRRTLPPPIAGDSIQSEDNFSENDDKIQSLSLAEFSVGPQSSSHEMRTNGSSTIRSSDRELHFSSIPPIRNERISFVVPPLALENSDAPRMDSAAASPPTSADRYSTFSGSANPQLAHSTSSPNANRESISSGMESNDPIGVRYKALRQQLEDVRRKQGPIFGTESSKFEHSFSIDTNDTNSTDSASRQSHLQKIDDVILTTPKLKEYRQMEDGEFIPVVETSIIRGSQRLFKPTSSPPPRIVAEIESNVGKSRPFHKTLLSESTLETSMLQSSPGMKLSPSSSSHRSQHSPHHPPILIDIDIGDGRIGEIAVHDGDSVRELAESFVSAFRLNKTLIPKLSSVIQEKIRLVKKSRRPGDLEQSILNASLEDEDSITEFTKASGHYPLRSVVAGSGRNDGYRPVIEPKPFKFATEKRAVRPNDSILKLHIDLGRGKTGTLAVRKGDDPYVLATNFVHTFSLRKSMIDEIVFRIQEQLEAYYIKENISKLHSDSPIFSSNSSYGTSPRESVFSSSLPILEENIPLSSRSMDFSDERTEPEKKARREVILVLDVDLPDGRSAKLRVRKGDLPDTAAEKFGIRYKLSPSMVRRLTNIITANL